MELTYAHPDRVASSPFHHIEVGLKSGYKDPRARHLLRMIREYFKLEVDDLHIVRIYTINKPLSTPTVTELAANLLCDPIVEEVAFAPIAIEGNWVVEVSFKPGVTDNPAKIAQLTFEDYLRAPFEAGESVNTSTKYIFKGQLTKEEVDIIARGLLANSVIEEIALYRNGEAPANRYVKVEQEFSCQNDHNGKVLPSCQTSTSPYGQFIQSLHVATIPLRGASHDVLKNLSRDRLLALSVDEMKTIQSHYATDTVTAERALAGLPADPTDVELEVFAQTWSEHCKHKIFNAIIDYTEEGRTEQIDSLFKTYIKRSTEELAQKIDWLVSVFTDNAGIIKLNDQFNLCFKAETHNSPSALDPYGGALTGILGVNRDIMGAGIGARLVANTDIFCFAPPNYDQAIPERLLHPRRVLEGVCRGIEHGGNKSGIPTVNGSLVFDERFLGKPLVYCGSVGIMPATVNGIPSHEKKICPGDLIIIAGGRTGKDGIHGATFSSEALHAHSPSTAVQIGDPFVQKKLHDFQLEARDSGLYRTVTDNGAGGFSSSVGELATLSGGCEIHLDRALLKQQGLAPWEILVSESQERMTFAVSAESKDKLFALSRQHEVELVELGTFTASGRLHVLHHGTTVALLDMHFLHHGLPKMHLEAEWHCKAVQPCSLPHKMDYTQDLIALLSRYNICSKESIVRQYDHEVQGGTFVKPFTGVANDGPSDAAVICPIETVASNEGFALSHGICPRYSDSDAYHMAANAIDEAIRNCVAVGGDPSYMAILDNFCWPDPVYDEKSNPDGKIKLAQLVRANKALYDYSKAFGTPIISGKDSMKNDYKIGKVKISVPPTLLISAIAKMADVRIAVTMDVKCSGDRVYVVGVTSNELGDSEYTGLLGISSGTIPHVDAARAKQQYVAVHRAIVQGLVSSCHDCSDGGLAVALAESAFAGGLGMALRLDSLPAKGTLTDAEKLFSESASRLVVTVSAEKCQAFEQCMDGIAYGCIGTVVAEQTFTIENSIRTNIHTLKHSWQSITF